MNQKEKLIAYCGLYCGDCHGYTGEVADLARDLRKKLREYRYDLFAGFLATTSFGKEFQDYETCYKVLGRMVGFRCHRGCREGGGSPFCKIRKCCERKKFVGCWECEEFEDCKKLEFLIPVHGDAHMKNLRAIKKKGTKAFVEGKHLWYAKPKS